MLKLSSIFILFFITLGPIKEAIQLLLEPIPDHYDSLID
jgi:hypothetical protein